MPGISTYLAQAHLAWLRGTQMPTPPTLYVGMFTSDPTDAPTGGTEVTTTIRAAGRPVATFAAPAAGSPLMTNDVAVNFGTSAGTVSGNVTHFAVFDAASGGNKLFSGQLDAPKPVTAGDPFTIPVGQLRHNADTNV